MSRRPAYVSSFLAGAMVLFIELAGARWLAPSFGSGLDVWASLLTVTLLAIALGAWAGGVLGDRSPRYLTLSKVWWGASLALGLCLPARHTILAWTGSLSPGWGALTAAFLLYLPGLFLLSAAAPLAVRIAAPSPDQVGRVVGRFSAVGTAGSCLGALLTGFVLVPTFPILRLFAGAAALAALIGLGLLPLGLKRPTPWLGVLAWGCLLYLLSPHPSTGNLAGRAGMLLMQDVRQSLQGQIRVVDTPQSRYLLLDGIIQGGQNFSDHSTVASYGMTMEALARMAVPHPRRVLVIGLGAAILPNRFQALGADVETVEINPQMVELAEKWFGFNPAPGHVHLEDGRRFLDRAEGPYDLILLDAFSGESVPGHLMTRECFESCSRLLAPGGVLVMNYVGFASGPNCLVPAALESTLRRVFGSVGTYALGTPGERDNLILVARDSAKPWGAVPGGIPGPPEDREKLRGVLDARREIPGSALVFRDDWHPVDWLDRRSRLGWRREALEFIRRYGIDG